MKNGANGMLLEITPPSISNTNKMAVRNSEVETPLVTFTTFVRDLRFGKSGVHVLKMSLCRRWKIATWETIEMKIYLFFGVMKGLADGVSHLYMCTKCIIFVLYVEEQ
jgi:hypothetical protein